MGYTQYIYKDAGPGDCEEHWDNPDDECKECEKNNEERDMLRYH